jgi:hypothetical protein
MRHDEIIAEVWRNRDAHAQGLGHDPSATGADLRARQAVADRELVDRRPRRAAPRTRA